MDTVYRAYFVNKALLFTSEGLSAGVDSVRVVPGDDISPAKLLKKIETGNILHIISDSPAETFADFCAQFCPVEAAGGLVDNADGKVLMIRRNGWWDLPKGHVESGESHPQAALREVEEETGLGVLELGELLTTTQHFYEMHGRWEMKRTWWYAMSCRGTGATTPQSEEGITEARWLGGRELWEALGNTYATIRDVFDAYFKN
jgi:8-oxo-dGTP pyrophosphatase MutT (NUDIX family)